MDGGDFTGADSVPGRKQTDALVDAMNTLGYRVANLSLRELTHGYETLLKRREAARFAMISANIVWQDSGEPVVDATRVETVTLREGARTEQIRIGFIGLSRNDPTFMEEGPDGRRIVTLDPVVAARKYLPGLMEKTDIVMALSSLDLDQARRLPKQVKGIDLLLGGLGTTQTRHDDFPEDTRIGKTRILYIGDQGKNLGEVRLFFNDHGVISRTQRRVVMLTRHWPDEPQLAELMERTKLEVNEWNRTNALAASPFAAPVTGRATEVTYTGSARCAPCHEDAFSTWENSGHAKAFATLVEANQDFNPRCVGCHTIGFGQQRGFVNARATPGLVNVGCESCHGPSSQHPETTLEGYGRTTAATCRTCHTSENSPDYDPGIYLPQIRHWAERLAAR